MSDDIAPEPSKKKGFFSKVAGGIQKAADDIKEREREARAAAGNRIHTGTFGGQVIEIFDRGYVRVSLGKYEKLRSVKHSFQVQDKSSGGRALAALGTLGASTLFSDEKRVVFLTIATDVTVHTLKATGGMARGADKAAMAIEAAAQAVIDGASAAASPSVSETPVAAPAQPDPLDQLKKLGELHAAGILSDEEFAAKKAEILGRM